MKNVLITGSSSGFGHAAALAFARAGDRVFASMRDTNKAVALREVAASEKLAIEPLALDVTQPGTFSAVIARVVHAAGRLDVLVNNAGIIFPGAFEDLSEGQIRQVMETNALAPLLLARAALPTMRKQRDGYIINISSLSGVAGLPGDVAYTASKFALEGATEALRHEVDRWGIKLALVEAGLYATRIFAGSTERDSPVPRHYPADSPYRALVSHKWRELQARLPDAFDPGIVGDLLVKISRSDGAQLRWPADAIAQRVLTTLIAQDDATRDRFLRSVSGTEWWSQGAEPPR